MWPPCPCNELGRMRQATHCLIDLPKVNENTSYFSFTVHFLGFSLKILKLLLHKKDEKRMHKSNFF